VARNQLQGTLIVKPTFSGKTPPGANIPPAKRTFIDASILSVETQEKFFQSLDALDSLAFAS
jgi:hypothetical protein